MVCGDRKITIYPVPAELRQQVIQQGKPLFVRQEILLCTEFIGIEKTDCIVPLTTCCQDKCGYLLPGRLRVGIAGKLEERTAVESHQPRGKFAVLPDLQTGKSPVRKTWKRRIFREIQSTARLDSQPVGVASPPLVPGTVLTLRAGWRFDA